MSLGLSPRQRLHRTIVFFFRAKFSACMTTRVSFKKICLRNFLKGLNPEKNFAASRRFNPQKIFAASRRFFRFQTQRFLFSHKIIILYIFLIETLTLQPANGFPSFSISLLHFPFPFFLPLPSLSLFLSFLSSSSSFLSLPSSPAPKSQKYPMLLPGFQNLPAKCPKIGNLPTKPTAEKKL